MNNERQGTGFSRAAERVKTAAIILLTVSALVLGWHTKLFNDIYNSIPFLSGVASAVRGRTAQPDGGDSVVKEAARPSCIVITGENGAHYGVRYDTVAKNTVYDRISGVLGEALGSAKTPVEITEQRWQGALSGTGVYFEYMTPVELSVLAGWFGADAEAAAGSMAVRRICVMLGGEMNKLYFQDEESGWFYESATASTGGRELYLSVYSSNGAVFAFETGFTYAEYAPYTVLIAASSHPVIRAAQPDSPQEPLDLILTAFGASSQIKPSYTDTDNALNYVGTGFTVKVSENGNAAYQKTEDIQTEPLYLTKGEMIERARIIIADTLEKSAGDAEVYYYNGFYNEDESFTVTFVYKTAGGLVYTKDAGRAATVTFSNGVVTHMEMSFRRYTVTDELIPLLPERQALALAEGEFILCYNDTGADRLIPEWVRIPGGET